ncbi:YcgN family cysteine cluster protein [uncultured Paracoccus sp.]|uniref:YcgN family cysteine cluster protein n=1 Tax=uncultured Paracoccus sp. TaxID=189685 RepID=UPI0026004B3B|nr:YcgN family cysteine cluster protein [uncultured Paracoccus sp.]
MRPRFWELPLRDLDREEWEALCDGCGKCCLNKIEFEGTGELAFTRVACKLLDGQSCQCSNYADRHRYVPECIVLTRRKLREVAWWLPATCAYRLRAEGKPLFDWHYLISGDRESVHRAGQSVRGWTISELEVREEDWEDHMIEDLS